MQDHAGSEPPAATEVLLAEYAAANSVYLQYDGFRWQAGSFLIAGVFVYWGFLMQSDASEAAYGISSLLVAALMSCWLLFATHYRQLYMQKLHRLWEIERALGMKQHLRFVTPAGSPRYRSYGIKGHDIDRLVYAITSLGGAAIFAANSSFTWWCLAPVPLVLLTLEHVRRNERAIQRRLKLEVTGDQ